MSEALPTVAHGREPSALPVMRTRTAPREASRPRAICARKSVSETCARCGYADRSAFRSACSSASTGPPPRPSLRSTSPATETSAEATELVASSLPLFREVTS
jgi:hypothetical protein